MTYGGSVWESNPPFGPLKAESPALKAGEITGPLSPPRPWYYKGPFTKCRRRRAPWPVDCSDFQLAEAIFVHGHAHGSVHADFFERKDFATRLDSPRGDYAKRCGPPQLAEPF